MLKKSIQKLANFLNQKIFSQQECTEDQKLIKQENEFGELCFSQTGEDGILRYLCGNSGFYVDVGAHHPIRFSNTHLLYKRGWRGINIDVNPGFKYQFDLLRPEDKNLEVAVGLKKVKKAYFNFEEPAYNTFDCKYAEKLIKNKTSVLLSKTKLCQYPLGDLCRENIPLGQKINLLNIDAEGSDYDILCSHDWFNFMPDILIIESLHNDLNYKKIKNLLKNLKFKKVGFTPFSAIYVSQI